jgi:UDP-N-acetylglucosamine 1-carboxyvinyltransferase
MEEKLTKIGAHVRRLTGSAANAAGVGSFA